MARSRSSSSSSFHSYIGKSTIQQNAKRFSSTSFSSSPDLRRAPGPANLSNFVRVAGDEEHRVAVLEAELRRGSRSVALRPEVLGDGPCAAVLVLAPEDVAEARLAFAPAPRRSCGRRSARLPPPGAGIAHTRALRSFSIMPANDLEAGAAEVLGHVRPSRSGCAGPACRCRTSASPRRRGCAGTARRHRLAVGELLEHAVHHRLDRGEHVLLRRRSSSRRRAGRTRPASGRRARPRRGSRARSGSSGRSPTTISSCLNCCGACGSA